jgi:hypothetical protein
VCYQLDIFQSEEFARTRISFKQRKEKEEKHAIIVGVVSKISSFPLVSAK